jgi:hypothetical protein
LASELAAAFGSMVSFYRKHYALSPEEARTRAATTPDHCTEHALSCEPSQLSWFDLNGLANTEPAKALARWEEVKEAARGELRSGHRAARAIEGCDSLCWKRARFLAIRAELTEAWRPRNAAEQHLIDQMAQWQDFVWSWQETMVAYHEIIQNGRSRKKDSDERLQPPRLSDAEALERATQMVERFQKLYLRSLTALRELRRLPPVVVRAAGQVNIGQQQVNVTGAGGR